MAKRGKKDVFSATKAVKANARERVGTPRPSHPLPDEKTKAERRARKHRIPLDTMLDRQD